MTHDDLIKFLDKDPAVIVAKAMYFGLKGDDIEIDNVNQERIILNGFCIGKDLLKPQSVAAINGYFLDLELEKAANKIARKLLSEASHGSLCLGNFCELVEKILHEYEEYKIDQ